METCETKHVIVERNTVATSEIEEKAERQKLDVQIIV